MNRKRNLLFLICALLLLTVALSVTAHADGYSSVFPKTQSAAEKNLITAEPLSLRDDADAVGVTALYTVNKDALATLEETYNVTFGALVARASDGYNLSTLKLSFSGGKLKVPKHAAMLTVYSTNGTRAVDAKFLNAAENSFSVTLDLGTKTVARAGDGVVHLAFVMLEEKGTAGEPRFFYIGRKGTSYGTTPSFESMKQTFYNNNKGDEAAVNEYIDFLQTQIESDVADFSDIRVMVCGDGLMASTLPKGERAIWIEYLPEKDPYPNARETVKKNVRAAYIYYPLDFDPSFETTSELAKLGVRRVFAYIAVPPYVENAPGLVCVHGGGGHAYAEYALEASMHGFAAIAIDTEGCYNMTGGNTPYSAADANYKTDSLGHGGKDNFANAEGSLSEQWLYYAVMDTVLANTVLRSMNEVDEDAVGITGISWGGLITSTAICYDHRYAFAAPIYISFHMSESYGISVGGLKNKAFAAALWQDTERLAKCPVPTLIISCENDLFASVDTVSKSANDLPNGQLLIKPRLLHGQQFGASLPEIYHFGYSVLGESQGFVEPKAPPTAEMGSQYTLTLEIPEGAEDVSATLYYLPEPLRTYGSRDDVYFEEIKLTVNQDGTVDVTVPDEAYLYFISFSYYDEAADRRQNGTPYLGSDQYGRGYIYSSTDLIAFN